LQNEKQLGQLALQNLLKRYDYHETGGAPLLGIDGICIICHGSSGERAIESALGLAGKYIQAKLNERIVKDIASNPTMASED
jgi:glycerol-3-phosphate acyltransferase PlsX